MSKYLSITSQAINIHCKCRHKFTSKRRLEEGNKTVDEMETHESNQKLIRSSIPLFDLKHHCFLYCGRVVIDIRHRKNSSVREVTTVEMKEPSCSLMRTSLANPTEEESVTLHLSRRRLPIFPSPMTLPTSQMIMEDPSHTRTKAHRRYLLLPFPPRSRTATAEP